MSHFSTRNQNSTGRTDTQTQPNASAQELARIATILSNERRQHIIRRIAEDGPQTKRELCQALYCIDHGECLDEIDLTHDEYSRYYTTLHQHHLPKLEEKGVLKEHDRRFYPAEDFDDVLSALNGILLSIGFGDELVGDVERPGDGGEDDD